MKAHVNVSNIQMLDLIWTQLQNSTFFVCDAFVSALDNEKGHKLLA